MKNQNRKKIKAGENGNTEYQNIMHAVKAVLTAKIKAINTYIKKKGRAQIIYITLHFDELEKEQTKPKVI